MSPKRSSKRPTLVSEPLPEFSVAQETKIEQAVLTVTQITQLIKGELETEFHDIWVEGEISNSKLSQAGHFYFSLKDKESLLSCVIFRMSLSNVKFELEDGLQVIVHGRISVYEARGQYQLIIDKMEIAGLGALQLAFEQLKEKLKKEGLFDSSHKRPLPMLPQKIGIVTSPTGAAIRDILHILNRRYTNLDIIIAPALVQGPQAAPQIVEAIEDLNRFTGLDVIIVTRGGGSLEDLWPFNEEMVARVVYNSRVPVISAVGHEIDYTICDFVADLRAPTPSAAAELVVRNKVELEEKIQLFSNSLISSIQDSLEGYKDQLDNLMTNPVFTQPTKPLETYSQQIDDLSDRLQRQMEHSRDIFTSRIKNAVTRLQVRSPSQKLALGNEKLSNIQKRLVDCIQLQIELSEKALQSKMEHLNALSPLGVLGRGYSITFQLPERHIVRDVNRLATGDKIEVRVHKGHLTAEVLSKEATDGGT